MSVNIYWQPAATKDNSFKSDNYTSSLLYDLECPRTFSTEDIAWLNGFYRSSKNELVLEIIDLVKTIGPISVYGKN